MTIDLKTDSGAAMGTVMVSAVLSQASLDDLAEALPESAVIVDQGNLTVSQVQAFDLKGGDADSLFGGKQVRKHALDQYGTAHALPFDVVSSESNEF